MRIDFNVFSGVLLSCLDVETRGLFSFPPEWAPLVLTSVMMVVLLVLPKLINLLDTKLLYWSFCHYRLTSLFLSVPLLPCVHRDSRQSECLQRPMCHGIFWASRSPGREGVRLGSTQHPPPRKGSPVAAPCGSLHAACRIKSSYCSLFCSEAQALKPVGHSPLRGV